tara:strand:+ start:137 stop:397 length:261 start_codon:yes stop_codon:yes gene_type:complete
MSDRSEIQRIRFDVDGVEVLSIIQGGGTYGIPGRTVEVAYYTPGSDERFDVMSFVSLEELRDILNDVLDNQPPFKVIQRYEQRTEN